MLKVVAVGVGGPGVFVEADGRADRCLCVGGRERDLWKLSVLTFFSFAFFFFLFLFRGDGGGGEGEADRGDNGAGNRVVGRAGLDRPCSETTVVFGKTGLVFHGECGNGHFACV